MKKSFNYYSIAVLFLSVVFVTSACTEDCDYISAAIPEANTEEVSFADMNSMKAELAPNDTKEITITVVRKNTGSALTVPILVNRNDEGIFEIPSSVSFDTNSQSAEIKITFPKAIEGVLYQYEIALDNAGLYSEATIPNMSGSVQCIQWNELGEGKFVSQFMGEDWPVVVYKANHTDWYKVYSLYEDGMDIVFKADESGKVIVEKQAAFTHDTYGTCSVKGNGSVKDGVITVTIEATVSAGSFGYFSEALQLP